jgi:hypothetical protein
MVNTRGLAQVGAAVYWRVTVIVRSTYSAVPKFVIFVEKVAEDAELEVSVTPLEPAHI